VNGVLIQLQAGVTGLVMMDSNGKDEKEQGTSPIGDPRELARNVVRLVEEGGKVARNLAEKSTSQAGPYSVFNELGEAAKIIGSVASQWTRQPAKLAEANAKLMQGYIELWGRSVRRALGEEVAPLIEPELSDQRFKDEDWSQRQYFDFVKQAYLLTANWLEDMVENTEGLDERTQHKAEFYTKLLAEALSPSNFPLTNPEVLRETLASSGSNLVRGMSQLAKDVERSDDLFRISQTDAEAFEVGKNLAVTPGKVVFQNDVIQLIQYSPSGETQHETPLLMVPPWINKFYILDLTAEKSFVKYVVDQGFTTFIVSWVDPDEHLAHKTFEDYMREGVLEAVDAVTRETGAEGINALGYCVGGTLLAATLAYMAATGDERIKSATFLTAQVDFSKAGDLLVFIDDAQLKSLEEMMAEVGYLDSSRMSAVFNMMRARDLIWPYVVNNYMLGKKPPPFDLLYWNADSTRMPAANHSFYLREFYHQNKLAKGEMELNGVKLDLSKVTMPVYQMAAREDHIAPAVSVFKGSRLFGGKVRFVLAGSGHIAGVVNPPAKPKYQYWTGPKKAADLEAWLAEAEEHPGSWWANWIKWLAKRSGDEVPARQPGAGGLGTIEDAPGSYVKRRSD